MINSAAEGITKENWKNLFQFFKDAGYAAYQDGTFLKSYLIDLSYDAFVSVYYPVDQNSTDEQKATWDAFRHAYTSARIAQFYGIDESKILGDMNEFHPDNTDVEMDFYNNDKAIELWGHNPAVGDFADIDLDLVDSIKLAIEQGQLVRSPEAIPSDYKHDFYFGESVEDSLPKETAWLAIMNFIQREGYYSYGPNGSLLGQIQQAIKTLFGLAKKEASPLVLDLDGDGVELASGGGSGAVYFDRDGDGYAEAGGWVAGGDGLLALDVNGNGKIDSGVELFGDAGGASNGFERLKVYDSNKDLKISSLDANYSQFKVWVDANQDGVSQTEELLSLSQLGITSIDLAYSQVNQENNGNSIKQTSTFTMNGATRLVQDAYFTVDRANSVFLGNYTLDPDAVLMSLSHSLKNSPQNSLFPLAPAR